MTSQELAKLCGVSKTTVSRVINNDPNVKEVTRKMILSAMEKYNYVPIASARRLAGIDSNIIGLFIMDINSSDSTSRISKSTYFSQLTNLIIDKANNSSFQVLVSIITTEKQLDEVKNLFISRTIFSGIFIGAYNRSEELDGIVGLGYPVIIVDREQDKNKYDDNSLVINIDNCTGAYNATNVLIEQGHKKIGHISGDLRKLSGLDRLEGYKQALIDAHIIVDETLIHEGNFQEYSGYVSAKKLIEEGNITAIFSGNDSMALGAIKAIKDLGRRVPQDIAIIGFDNIETGNYISPTLSTVHGHLEDVAKHCIESLQFFYEKKYFETKKITLGTELVLRESTKSE